MNTLMDVATVPFGSNATLTSVNDAQEAQQIAACLRASLSGVARSVVPGADSVVVTAADGVALTSLMDAVTAAIAKRATPALPASRRVEIPVRYDGEDIAEVATLLGVSCEEVVARHSGSDYAVEFLGFAPGFPYLSGLDPLLASVPRLDTPRIRVAAGSVGIAAGRTCVYPTVSPGGWRLLGTTDMVLFDPSDAVSPARLLPGDVVRFVPTGC